MKRASHAPMFWILLPLLVGIVASDSFHISPLYSILILLLLSLLQLRYRHAALLYPIIALLGVVIASSHRGDSHPLQQQSDAIVALRTSDRGSATLVAQRLPDGAWHACEHKVWFKGDDSLQHATFVAHCTIQPFDSPRSSYKGQVTLLKVLAIAPTGPLPIPYRLNSYGLKRLRELNLSEESFATAAAVGVARRDALDETLIEAYNKSGTSHLLSLSGMHLGVVLLIITLLSYFMPLLPLGHAAVNIFSIVAIWLFAAMAGCGESILRAASMYSLIHLGALLSQRSNSLNNLSTAAVIILCLDPQAIYDVGFCLSFTAVAAIILVGAPLSTALRSGNSIIDFALASLIIGIIATAATIPLISHYFGYIALLSPLATPPLLLPLSAIIVSTIVWIIAPLQPLSYLLRPIIEISATIQNYTVEWFATLPFTTIDYRLSTRELLLSYVILAIVGALIRLLLSRQRD